MTVGFEVLDDGGGVFVWPDWIDQAEAALDRAMETYDNGGCGLHAHLAALERIAARHPDFVDGHAQLGGTLLEEGKPRKGLEAYRRGIAAAERAIPAGYAGRIEWGHVDNRPYLRALHGAALCESRAGRRAEAAALMERLLALNPNDNLGVRWLVGSEYLRLGRRDEARAAFADHAYEYPPGHYELGLLHIQERDWTAAATSLRRGFHANFYVAELLGGNVLPIPLAIWHFTNLAEPETAHIYVRDHGRLWAETPDALVFLRWLYNHSAVLAEGSAAMALREALLWETEVEARKAIAAREDAALARIDDRLSAELVAPRRGRNGQTCMPWEDPRRR